MTDTDSDDSSVPKFHEVAPSFCTKSDVGSHRRRASNPTSTTYSDTESIKFEPSPSVNSRPSCRSRSHVRTSSDSTSSSSLHLIERADDTATQITDVNERQSSRQHSIPKKPSITRSRVSGSPESVAGLAIPAVSVASLQDSPHRQHDHDSPTVVPEETEGLSSLNIEAVEDLHSEAGNQAAPSAPSTTGGTGTASLNAAKGLDSLITPTMAPIGSWREREIEEPDTAVPSSTHAHSPAISHSEAPKHQNGAVELRSSYKTSLKPGVRATSSVRVLSPNTGTVSEKIRREVFPEEKEKEKEKERERERESRDQAAAARNEETDPLEWSISLTNPDGVRTEYPHPVNAGIVAGHSDTACELGSAYFTRRPRALEEQSKQALVHKEKQRKFREAQEKEAVRPPDVEKYLYAPRPTSLRVSASTASTAHRVLRCQPSDLVKRLYEDTEGYSPVRGVDDMLDGGHDEDGADVLAACRAKTEMSRKLREEKMRELRELDAHIAASTAADAAPPVRNPRQRRSNSVPHSAREVILDKICHSWGAGYHTDPPPKHRQGAKKQKKAKRKKRGRVGLKAGYDHFCDEPRQSTASPLTRSASGSRSAGQGGGSSSPPENRERWLDKGRWHPWRSIATPSTRKDARESLPFTSVTERLHDEAEMWKQAKERWAREQKQRKDEWEVAKHPYRPAISDYAKKLRKSRRASSLDQRRSPSEDTRRRVAERYGDEELKYCTFHPSTNPTSAAMVSGKRSPRIIDGNTHNRLYDKGVAMRKRREAFTETMQQQQAIQDVPQNVVGAGLKLYLGSDETERWLRRMSAAKEHDGLYHAIHDEHANGKRVPSRSGGTERSGGYDALHNEAQELQQRRESLDAADREAHRLNSNVAQYLSKKSLTMATRREEEDLLEIFQLFRPDSRGFIVVPGVEHEAGQRVKEPYPLDRICAILRSSKKTRLTFGEFKQAVLPHLKKDWQFYKHGKRASSLPNRPSADPPKRQKSARKAAGPTVHDKLFQLACIRQMQRQHDRPRDEDIEECTFHPNLAPSESRAYGTRRRKTMAAAGGSSDSDSNSGLAEWEVADGADPFAPGIVDACMPSSPPPPVLHSQNPRDVVEYGKWLMRQQLQNEGGQLKLQRGKEQPQRGEDEDLVQEKIALLAKLLGNGGKAPPSKSPAAQQGKSHYEPERRWVR